MQDSCALARTVLLDTRKKKVFSLKVLENRVPNVGARVNTLEAETLRGILTNVERHSDWKEVTHVTSLSELFCKASVLPRKSPRLLTGVWLCWTARRSCNSIYCSKPAQP